MKKSELFDFFAVLQIYYPSEMWAANPSDMALNLWHEMVGDHPTDVVYAALKCHVAKSVFPPKVSDILREIRNLKNAGRADERLSAEQAWALVMRAIGNSGYHAKEEFDKLPASVRKCVGGHEMLRSWAMAEDDGATISVARSIFIRAYDREIERNEEYANLPESVRKLFSAVSQKQMIESGDDSGTIMWTNEKIAAASK